MELIREKTDDFRIMLNNAEYQMNEIRIMITAVAAIIIDRNKNGKNSDRNSYIYDCHDRKNHSSDSK
jgi:hypothetical protein